MSQIRRRITPNMMIDYWPEPRVALMRKLWPTYTFLEAIMDQVNDLEAPKKVTVWHCRMMAAHMKLRRPPHWREFHKRVRMNGWTEKGANYLKRELIALDKELDAPKERLRAAKPSALPPRRKKRKTPPHTKGLRMGKRKIRDFTSEAAFVMARPAISA